MKNLIVTVNGVAYNVTVEEKHQRRCSCCCCPGCRSGTRRCTCSGCCTCPHPVLPLVLFLSTLPCPAPSWTSRSRQALLLRLAMLS